MVDFNLIEDRLKDISPEPMDIKRKYAVLIPIIENKGSLEVIYELRSEMITQPGEISFPGGELEGSETYQEAAIRETMEELNIARDKIEVLGELNYLVSYAGITIHCFVGKIKGLDFNDIRPNHDEVDHIFTVPLDFLLANEPDQYYLDLETVINKEFPYNLIPNGKDYNWRVGRHSVMFYFFKNYIIWGFTARMTKELINKIRT